MLAIIQMLTNWSWPNLFGFWECNSLAWLQFLCNLTGWTSIVTSSRNLSIVYNTIYQYCLSTVPIKCITSCIPFVRVGLLKFCPCQLPWSPNHHSLYFGYYVFYLHKGAVCTLSLLPLTIFKGTYMYIYIYIYIYTHTHISDMSNLTVAT